MNLGLPEMMIIFILALLLFGPKKLPEIGRTLGRAMSEFRRATDDLKSSLEREVDLDQHREEFEGLKQDLKDARVDLDRMNDLTNPVKNLGKDLGKNLKG